MSIASKLLGMIPWGRARPQEAASIDPPAPSQVSFPTIAGSQPQWLRVLSAEQLLTLVQSTKAIKEIYRQSHQSELLWERDLLPAIHRYAEFVQLMPASEAHHHAHAGGLLSHTIEMLLAAMTLRNAHLLPEGSAIEVIDHQRDHWTYVVFFAALLHDIAKPMTDLRIQWRCDGMADAIRWAAGSGSLAQITQGRQLPEYLVGFAPKSQRDYSAHAKLAQLLLPSIAPQSAMTFLASQPEALDVLHKYLSGQDKESLVAKIVKRADMLSTKRALQSGSRARFASARAVPLIDLLMQAMASMLRAGTTLPLNRTGATGWVFEGAVWFVAKRLADLVRDWIKTHEPDEAIPGEAKNDRLFDTWQEYGMVDLNPATGQAIWHVQIQGNAQGEQGAYVHELAMLKFPLSKVFASESQYPTAMRGQLVVLDKRRQDAPGNKQDVAPALSIPEAAPENDLKSIETETKLSSIAINSASESEGNHPKPAPVSSKKPDPDPVMAAVLRQPTFNKPAPAKPEAKSHKPAPGSALTKLNESPKKKPAAETITRQKNAPESASAAVALQEKSAPAVKADVSTEAPQPTSASQNRAIDQLEAGEDAYLLDSTDFLDAADSARSLERGRVNKKPSPNLASSTAAAAQVHETGASAAPIQSAAPGTQRASTFLWESGAVSLLEPNIPQVTFGPEYLAPEPIAQAAAQAPTTMRVSRELRDLVNMLDEMPQVLPRAAVAQAQASGSHEPLPVLLVQELPKIPGHATKPQVEPSELAIDFMQWVQQGLVQRTIKFNEAGAAVHFVPEGMALVSPRIFRDFASEVEGAGQAHELGAKVQREVIKCGWHLPAPNRTNIVKYEIQGRGGAVVGTLSCVVLVNAGKWVQPVPPSNPALRMV